jgi:large subunit ribosomal protein L22
MAEIRNNQKRRALARQESQKAKREERAVAVSSVLRMSATKVRRVADLVRGKSLQDALTTCDFLPHRAAPEVKKVLLAAAGNAEENEDSGLDRDSLYVATVEVMEGFTIPRIRPRAQGRAYRIRKRTCRLRIEVGERDEE